MQMFENLDVKIEGKAYGIKVTQQGFFRNNLGKVKCAVCPVCGYTELYIDPEKLKQLND